MDFSFFFRKVFDPDIVSNPDSFEPDDFESKNEKHDFFVDGSFAEKFNTTGHIFQQMEDMFNRIFSSSFSIVGSPYFEENMLSNFEEQMPKEENPRSIMLKDPEEKKCSKPSCKKAFEGSSLLPNREESSGKSWLFSYSKFSSIRTVHLPDGTVEEHRTVIDSDGNKTTEVCRTIGNTTHVITKSDKDGVKEKEEKFLNMDESEIADFEKKWSRYRDETDLYAEPSSLILPRTSPTYLYLLKKFFRPWQKEELKSC